MDYTITQESFASLSSYWVNSRYELRWEPIFVLPAWLEVWWRVFGSGEELYLAAVRQEEKIIGVAPLLVRDKMASLLGSADVCDYLDFVVSPGRERDFFTVLLDDLRQQGISQLDLRSLRPASTVLTKLVPVARDRGYDVSLSPDGISLELDLPATWDEYLETLGSKQRHEVRRKLRRLGEAGSIDFRMVADKVAVHGVMDTFLNLFRVSRKEKAAFMTAPMESFFRLMADTMAETGVLRVGILEVDTQPAAMVMGFDYRDSVYLYNSGYDPQYRSLSVGVLAKVLWVKDSIERGKKRFDFLSGAEPYKYRLGGKELPLYRCRIIIK